jgi:ubiquinone/menaquinone biosynthesis C-methylase UbiE
MIGKAFFKKHYLKASIYHEGNSMTLNANEQLYRQRLWNKVASHVTMAQHWLDAGCGPGAMAEYLSNRGYQVTGIDIEPHPRWQEISGPGLRFRIGDIEQLPLDPSLFDAIWVQDALHHTPHPQRALHELTRVLKPGGTIILVEANRYNPLFYFHMTLLRNHQHFSKKQLLTLVQGMPLTYELQVAESRCFPWQHPGVLYGLNLGEEWIERMKIWNAWLTYHILIMKKNR